MLKKFTIICFKPYGFVYKCRKGGNRLEFLEPEAGVADVEVALFAEVLDLVGGDDVDDNNVDGNDDDDEVLDLLGRPHIPRVNWFSRPTSLLFLFFLDCHRDRWHTPSVARLQGNRPWPSLNRFLL